MKGTGYFLPRSFRFCDREGSASTAQSTPSPAVSSSDDHQSSSCPSTAAGPPRQHFSRDSSDCGAQAPQRHAYPVRRTAHSCSGRYACAEQHQAHQQHHNPQQQQRQQQQHHWPAATGGRTAYNQGPTTWLVPASPPMAAVAGRESAQPPGQGAVMAAGGAPSGSPGVNSTLLLPLDAAEEPPGGWQGPCAAYSIMQLPRQHLPSFGPGSCCSSSRSRMDSLGHSTPGGTHWAAAAPTSGSTDALLQQRRGSVSDAPPPQHGSRVSWSGGPPQPQPQHSSRTPWSGGQAQPQQQPQHCLVLDAAAGASMGNSSVLVSPFDGISLAGPSGGSHAVATVDISLLQQPVQLHMPHQREQQQQQSFQVHMPPQQQQQQQQVLLVQLPAQTPIYQQQQQRQGLVLTAELSGPLSGRLLSDSGVSGSHVSYGLPVAASPARSTPAFSAPQQLLPAGGLLAVQQQGPGGFPSVAVAPAGVSIQGPGFSSGTGQHGHAPAVQAAGVYGSSSARLAAPVPLPSPSSSFGAPDSSTQLQAVVGPLLAAGQQQGLGGVSGQLGTESDDSVDTAALAAAVAQEKLAQLQQIKDAQRALLDDILELLPLM